MDKIAIFVSSFSYTKNRKGGILGGVFALYHQLPPPYSTGVTAGDDPARRAGSSTKGTPPHLGCGKGVYLLTCGRETHIPVE